MLVTFSPTIWYRLHNNFLGRSIVLDVVNDGDHESSGKLEMADVGDYSGQFWQLRHHHSNDGTYTLCSWFLGPDRTLGIEDKDLSVKLHASDGINTQKWKIAPWISQTGEGKTRWDGTYKLVSGEECWNGRELCLDTYSNTCELYGGTGNHSGKHWTITPVEKIDGRAVEFLNNLGV